MAQQGKPHQDTSISRAIGAPVSVVALHFQAGSLLSELRKQQQMARPRTWAATQVGDMYAVPGCWLEHDPVAQAVTAISGSEPADAKSPSLAHCVPSLKYRKQILKKKSFLNSFRLIPRLSTTPFSQCTSLWLVPELLSRGKHSRPNQNCHLSVFLTSCVCVCVCIPLSVFSVSIVTTEMKTTLRIPFNITEWQKMFKSTV